MKGGSISFHDDEKSLLVETRKTWVEFEEKNIRN